MQKNKQKKNKQKTVIHISGFVFFVRYRLLFKNFTDLQQILEIKKKKFPQLLALGPQIALKRKRHHFLS